MKQVKLYLGAAVWVLLFAAGVTAQVTTGALQGTVQDPAGAVVPNAQVSVTNLATGATFTMQTNEIGFFRLPNLLPGNYRVEVEAAGFKRFRAENIPVEVGATTPLLVKLELGAVAEVVEVTSAEPVVTVDTATATIQGVLTTRQIESLPMQGRTFLDLAQLEPGVQIRDAGDFDPTKNQYTAISTGGRSGRATRITIDGVDVTDETVGTTVMNISVSAIQEFQVSQSTLDPSTDITSSGAVNIITRSGGNTAHGTGFLFLRSDDAAARVGATRGEYGLEQVGFDLGGPFKRDKLFWFLAYEHTNIDNQAGGVDTPMFPQFTGLYAVPVDETHFTGRADWLIRSGLSAFARFSTDHNFGVTGYGSRDLSAFANENNTNQVALGADFSGTRFTNSLRFGHTNFDNMIVDANAAARTPTTLDPAGRPVLIQIYGQLTVGPDLLAPQETREDKYLIRDDLTFSFGRHTLRGGVNISRVFENVYASFYGLAPRIRSRVTDPNRSFATACAPPFPNCLPGGVTEPLNWPLDQFVFGNGLGFFSERPTLHLPFGGTPITRLAWYIADSWKVRRDLTLNYGVRYQYDSAQSNADLVRTPKLNEFMPGLANKSRHDMNNFGPSLGIAWDIGGKGKTVVRAGTGFYYDVNIINSFLFDRVYMFPVGIGNDTPVLQAGYRYDVADPITGATLVSTLGPCDFTPFFTAAAPPGSTRATGTPLNGVIPLAVACQAALQARSALGTANFPDPSIPPLFDLLLDAGGSILAPPYHTPYSWQLNAGVQREIRQGWLVSADYIRNVNLHSNLTRDFNRIGAADTLDVAMAAGIRDATNADYGCGPGLAGVNCAIAAGASILDYAAYGLDAGSALDGYAFRGLNPNFYGMGLIMSGGRSEYDALQVKIEGRFRPNGRALKSADFTVSYTLSEFRSFSGDQDFLSGAVDNDRPLAYFGPANLDRTHQLAFSAVFDLPHGLQVSTINHIRSGFASSLYVPEYIGLGEIFFTDFNGDGTVGDPLPETNLGAFARSVNSVKKLNALISAFDTNFAGNFTPAAQALVTAGLFTQAQLQALGAVIPTSTDLGMVPAPANQVFPDSFLVTNIRVSYNAKVWEEKVTLSPFVEVFNVFNFANYDGPGGRVGGVLNGSPGSPNGTIPANRTNRIGLGSGTFAQGSPRAFQFGIKVTF